MDFIPKKKEKEIEEIQQDNIYEEFEKENTKEEAPVEKEEIKEEKQEEKKEENLKYQEKEYPKGSLEKYSKVTKPSMASRFILIGFYLLIVVVAVLAVLLIRTNKYEFYFKSEEVVINVGSMYQIELTPKDERYFDYLNYDYKIADESIATVDEYGTITTKKEGVTTLKISLNAGFSSKTVRIVSTVVDVTSIEIKKYNDDKLQSVSTINMDIDDSVTIKAIANGDESINATANYTSSNPKVAVVDIFGNITAKEEGTTVISGEINGIMNSVTVIVNKPVTPPTSNTKSRVAKISIGLANQTTKYVGDTLKLNATLEPSTATGYKVKWSSSNSKVATVDSDGKVVCKKIGTVVISAEADGVKASRTIVVREK